jgi:hypothetical protein
MKTLQDIVRLPPDEELVDDARQVAIEGELARLSGLLVGQLLALTKGEAHETLEDLLFGLAEGLVEAGRADGFDDLAAEREVWRG